MEQLMDKYFLHSVNLGLNGLGHSKRVCWAELVGDSSLMSFFFFFFAVSVT
jgi:hypothetical protein